MGVVKVVKGKVVEVWVNTMRRSRVYRTKDVKRTIEKLLKKYSIEAIAVVEEAHVGYYVYEWDLIDEVWRYTHVAIHPFRTNALNAYGERGVVGKTLDELQRFIFEDE